MVSPKFKNVAIYSSLKDKKVVDIADQVEEVLSNLGVRSHDIELPSGCRHGSGGLGDERA